MLHLQQVNLLKVHQLTVHLEDCRHWVQVQIAGVRVQVLGDITWGQWRQIGTEVAALGLNFNEISAANSGRKERRDVMRGRMRRR